MAVSYSVSTKITASDAASGVINNVKGAFGGLLSTVRRFTGLTSRAEAAAGLSRVGVVVGNLHTRFRGLLDTALQFAPALGAIGAVGSAMGLLKLTQDYASMADALGTTATKIGMPVEQLQQLRFAAKMANVEAETFDKGLVKLNKTVFEAANGKNKDAAALFARLGINLRDSKGQIRSVADLMPQLAKAFAKNENPAVRTAMAMALFGKAGADLIPLLEQGDEALIKYMLSAKQHGLVTDEQVSAAGQLDDAFDHLGAAGAGLGNRIAAALVPTLLPLVKGLTDWIDRNREMIGQAVERKVQAIARAIDFVQTAVRKFLALPVVDAFMKSEAAGKVLDIALVALAGTLAGPLLTAIQLVGRAFLLNPIGLAVAAIAGLVYVIYDNWGNIVAWFEGKIARVKAAFDKGFIQGIGSLLMEFSPVRLLSDAINGLSKYLFGVDLYAEGAKILGSLTRGLTDKLDRIGAAFDRGIIQGIAAVLQEFDPIPWIAAKINGVITWLTGVDLSAEGARIVGGLIQGLTNRLDFVAQAFDRGIVQGVAAVLQAFDPLPWIADKVNAVITWLTGVDLRDAGRRLLQGLIDGIKSLLPDLTALIAPVKDAFSWVDRQWNRVKGGAGAVADAGTQVADAVGRGATTLVQGQAPPPARVEGQVRVAVDFSNLPQGARVSTEENGQVATQSNVGYSMAAP